MSDIQIVTAQCQVLMLILTVRKEMYTLVNEPRESVGLKPKDVDWTPAKCITLKLILVSPSKNIKTDRLNVQIEADHCNITLTDGTNKIIEGRNPYDMDDFHITDTKSVFTWIVPKSCPYQIHYRMVYTGPDSIRYIHFDATESATDICLKRREDTPPVINQDC